MPEARGKVPGRRGGRRVTFYGLSTCVWCRRTRELLEKEQVGFDYVYLDLLQGAEREEALAALRRWNTRVTYPTLVVDDERCVVGFVPEEIREVLEL